MKNLVTTIKSWNIKNFHKLKNKDEKNDWYLITKPEDFTKETVAEINPQYIFIPHWSWIIPEEMWKNYETIVFHETDLPYGRGGSPIQNLIARGQYQTKISALKVDQGFDSGDIYMKKDFDMAYGNVKDILSKSSDIIFGEMIPEIIKNKPKPKPQEGEIVTFKRRKPEQGNLLSIENPTPRKLYDWVRMLDGEGYPRAFIPLANGRLEYFDASLLKGEFDCKTEFVKNE